MHRADPATKNYLGPTVNSAEAATADVSGLSGKERPGKSKPFHLRSTRLEPRSSEMQSHPLDAMEPLYGQSAPLLHGGSKGTKHLLHVCVMLS